MAPLSTEERKTWRKLALLGLVMILAILLQYASNHLERTNDILFGDTTQAGSSSEAIAQMAPGSYVGLLVELLIFYAPGALLPSLVVLVCAEVLLPAEHFLRQRLVIRTGEGALFMGLLNVVLVSYGTLFSKTTAEIQIVVRLYHLVWIVQLLLLNNTLFLAGTSLWQTRKLPRWLSAMLLIAPLLSMPMIVLRINTESVLALGMMAALPTQITGLVLFSFMGLTSLSGKKAKQSQKDLNTQEATHFIKVRSKA